MSESKHTPGPWKIGNGDIFAEGNRASDFDDIVICAIGQAGYFRSSVCSIVPHHRPEGKANARLIAAAPAMLAALKAAAPHVENAIVSNQINAAIRAAEGEG